MSEYFVIANRTDTGQVRQVNEDSMTTFDSPNGRVVAVCDGMGGQAAGDVASRLACDIISDILENNTFGSPSEAITRAMMAANQGILHRASQYPDLEGMGATCVMAIIKDGAVTYGWVGDSRIYYVSHRTIRQISRDQSYVQSLVDSGQITPEEAENHPRKNEIINALGINGMTPPEVCTMPLIPEPGSILMLCSDGLSGQVSAQSMEHILSNEDLSLQEKADRLVGSANAAGGPDNITVQLVQFGKPAQSTASGKGKSKLILWIAVTVVVIGVILAAVLMLRGNKKKPDKEPDPVMDTRAPKPVRTQEPAVVIREAQPEQKVVTTTVRKTKPEKKVKNQSVNPEKALQNKAKKSEDVPDIKNRSNGANETQQAQDILKDK